MKEECRKLISVVSVMALVFGMMRLPVLAQEAAKPPAKKAVSAKGAKGTITADAANIKSKDVINDRQKTVLPPERKAGKTRGSGPWACTVRVDNETAFSAWVAVDGYVVGVVGPYGDLNVTTGNGATTVYSEADFNDGSDLHWNFPAFTCVSGSSNLIQLLL